MARLPDDDRTGSGMPAVLRYDGRRLVPVSHTPIPELSVSLSVNGAPFANLLASPHDLHYLVSGFLRLQGVIRTPADLLSLTVLEQQGSVSVRIRGEAPGPLAPDVSVRSVLLPGSGPFFRPEAIFRTMGALARHEDGCREYGGIHRAGAGDGERLLLSAEDIGRHNAVDRIAGEALLKGIDLSGRILAVTGRVSSGVAAKAGFLGVSTIVSQTCPTESAIRSCGERGITLVGCVRGGRFNVYSHPERIATSGASGRIPGVTGAILSGGPSYRMGCDKALLPYRGGRFIEAIHRKMAELFDEVIVVGVEPEQYDFMPCRLVPDRFPGMGALGGIHSALFHSATDRVFVVACDMPYVKGDLIRFLCSLAEDSDVVVPEGESGPVPLHALYRKSALPALEDALRDGRRGLDSFHDRLRVRRVARETVDRFDPGLSAFRNINTPEDYFRFRREGEFPPG
ncbi:MAG: formate dehydrogenase accessory sulfurtransferase FdhD [Thermodesulfobacteriota bacterium]